ncbi:MAG: amino acid ABC transporter substrate-binding protein [Sutterellaceae bacterium]|nr:amino acid ABC transporter substrate-binding protein [Sutterellaceae bacterium]
MNIKAIGVAVGLAAMSLSVQAGAVLDAVKARGQVICGVNTAAPGFSHADSKGEWTGLDVDTCRAVAAAVLGDAQKVKFVPLSSPQRFTALQSGEIDMLARNTTWTLTRDASLGAVFAAISYYDGQGFMVPKKLGVTSAKQLNGATVCLQSGTSSVQTLADYFAANNMKYKPVMFDTTEATQSAFLSGRCQVYTTDMSDLAGARTRARNPQDFVILPETISKEPLGPSVRRGDDEWFQIVRWSFYTLLEAEESGLTKANVDEMRASSKSPQVMRLVGTGDDTGKLLGLDKEWSYRIIKQVGNYGESWTANFGPNTSLNLPRGLNNLWTQGGIMYAPPIR